ncbi:hypothetical protein D3C73_1596720 [compost metagenome]
MVPHDFGASLWNGKRNAAVGTSDRIAAVGCLCAGRIAERVVIHPLRQGRRTMGGIHVQAKGVGILPE